MSKEKGITKEEKNRIEDEYFDRLHREQAERDSGKLPELPHKTCSKCGENRISSTLKDGVCWSCRNKK